MTTPTMTTPKSNNIYWYGGIILVLILIIIGYFVFRPNNEPEEVSASTQEFQTREQSTKGNPDAKVEIIEYSDFQCPACAYAAPVLQQIYEQYGNQITISFKHLPLNQIHPNANIASNASESAGAQGKFWEMHDILFIRQQEWGAVSQGDAQKLFIEYAKAIDVENIDQFTSDLEQQTFQSIIDEDMAEAQEREIQGTPSIYVNGEHIYEWKFENIEKEIHNGLESQ